VTFARLFDDIDFKQTVDNLEADPVKAVLEVVV